MKKTIAVLFAIASAAVFAGMNDVLVSFNSLYTPDTDKYADGTTVLDGEWYALVCIKDGKADIVDAASLAKDGRCPRYVFTIDESKLDAYAGGVLGVYLLDTRDFSADPSGKKRTENLGENGYPVYNAMAATKGEMKRTGNFASATAGTSVSAGSYDLAAAGVKSPKVTSIDVSGDEVVVTVSDTVPFVGYTLESGDGAFNFMVLPGADTSNGNATGVITLKAPKKDGAQFFKVSSIK